MFNEFEARQLVEDRVREAHARAAVARALRDASPPASQGRVVEIRDLGQLALVALVVMVLGIGVIGLWTAATEPVPRRSEVLPGLTRMARPAADDGAAGPRHPGGGPRPLR